MPRGAAIGTDIRDRRRLFADVVHVVSHQHQAEEGIFERTLEVDKARTLETR